MSSFPLILVTERESSAFHDPFAPMAAHPRRAGCCRARALFHLLDAADVDVAERADALARSGPATETLRAFARRVHRGPRTEARADLACPQRHRHGGCGVHQAGHLDSR